MATLSDLNNGRYTELYCKLKGSIYLGLQKLPNISSEREKSEKVKIVT